MKINCCIIVTCLFYFSPFWKSKFPPDDAYRADMRKLGCKKTIPEDFFINPSKNISLVFSDCLVCFLKSILLEKMPNRCGLLNCNGNNNKFNKCRVFRLPREEEEKQMWLDVLPVRRNFSIDPRKYFICERHCHTGHLNILKSHYPVHLLPFLPPNDFNVPPTCLPTPKVPPRKRKTKTDFWIISRAKIQYLLLIHLHPRKNWRENMIVCWCKPLEAWLICAVIFSRQASNTFCFVRFRATGSKVYLQCIGSALEQIPACLLSMWRQHWKKTNQICCFFPGVMNPLQLMIALEHCCWRCFLHREDSVGYSSIS